MKEAYINGRIIDPEKNKEFVGDIVIEKDKIVDVGPNIYKKEKPKSYTNIHDCKGLSVCPGLLDMRVSFGEPTSEHNAAFAGGITTVSYTHLTLPTICSV